jgi:ElaB/YqjD/DUF883 family membrane-anchored ribosome-binding protein
VDDQSEEQNSMESKESRLESQPLASIGAIDGAVRKDAVAAARSVSEAAASGKEALGALAAKAVNSGQSDLDSLRREIDRLRDTVSDFISRAGKEAGEAASHVTAGIAEQASHLAAKGSEMGVGATEQAKTLAADVEQIVRRNPLGAIASAVTVGVLIGLLGRRN